MKIEDNDFPLVCLRAGNIFKFPIQIELNNTQSTRKQNFLQNLTFAEPDREVEVEVEVDVAVERSRQNKAKNLRRLATTFIIHFCLSVTIFALYDFRVRAVRVPWVWLLGPQIMQLQQQLRNSHSGNFKLQTFSGCILLLAFLGACPPQARFIFVLITGAADAPLRLATAESKLTAKNNKQATRKGR